MSVDNIDFQNSYSHVFCGKQKSSWHGTTVQVVQPSIITNDLYDQCNSTEPLQVHSPCSTHGESTSSMLTNEVQYENRHLECKVYGMPITQRRKRKVTTISPCSSPHKYWYSQSPIPKSGKR